MLSFEPPWRRSAELIGSPLEVLQLTFVLRDDESECHLAAALVGDPEPTPEGWAFLERVLEALEAAMKQIATAAEAEIAPPQG